MKIIKIKISNGVNKINQAEIDLIVEYLKSGKVMAYPTDTVYGLGCDARNALAIKKINKIKGEKTKKPLLVLISDFKMLKKYCFVNSRQLKYLKKVWPGPVTAILKCRSNLPAELTGGLDSLAVRLPKAEFLVKIISKCGFPLVSTSLNKKGAKPLLRVENLPKHFKYLPDLAVDAGECKNAKLSRLVDIRDMKNIKVIRK